MLKRPIAVCAALALLWAGYDARAQTFGPGPNTAVSIWGRDAVTGAACVVGVTTTCQVQTNPGTPYAYTSVGFQQISVTSSAAVTIVPGAGSTICFIVVETNPVRYRTDGTAPTTSVGMPLATYTPTGGGGPQLTLTASGAKFIATTGTATLDVDCDR